MEKTLPTVYLARHGETLPLDGGNSEEILAEFAKEGVDVDALATQLQNEGARSFVNSWTDLMAVISSKSVSIAKRSMFR